MPSVGLYTLGCKVSQYETEAIAEKFEKCGFVLRDFTEVCDVYVINTCTVTAESDRKSGQIIRRAIKKNPSAVVCVVGCYSQREPERVAAIDGVRIVLGTENKLSVVDAAIKALSGDGGKVVSTTDLRDAKFERMCITRAPRTRAYVKIQDGCESKCSYCAIAAARGGLRSKPREDVIAEVEALSASGVREVVLTGIETGAYGRDFDNGYRLCDLIRELDERKSCERIRLGSLAPELCGADFVNGIKGCAILAPHFHLSLQSGSDAVLFAMRRRYSAARAMENVERLREAFPNANFTTDIMVGFPGESDEDFLKTLQFVKQARFLDVHVFSYSQRKGTDAAEMCGQIPPEVKRRRSEQLMQLKCEVRDSILDGIISSSAPLSVVCESRAGDFYLAHSDSFVEVCFPHHDGIDPVGEICKVRPVSHKDGVISAELVEICK